MSQAPAIVAGSCFFSAGPSLPLADLAVLTTLALPSKHPFFVDRGGRHVRINAVFDLAPEFSASRWCKLARSALDELADTLAEHGVLRRLMGECVLWLVLPREERAGVPPDLPDRLRLHLRDERFAWCQVHTSRGGHAAGIHVIRQAARDDRCLNVVLGLDCWGHPEALQWLEDLRLLHGAHTLHEGIWRPNPYGRVPGEAAAALAILPIGKRRPWGRSLPSGASATPVWALIAGTALAEEPNTFDAGTPCLGAGLTLAATGALDAARLPERSIRHVSTDLNGEPYRADEFGFAALRLTDRLAPGWQRLALAEVAGDTGSASAVLQTALAAHRMHRERGTGRKAGSRLVLASSDDALRAALVLAAPDIGPT